MSLTFSRRTDYALVALSALARERLGKDEPVSARFLSERYGLPLQLLMNVLKDLHRAELVASRRGASGGYYLMRDAVAINLKDVIVSLEGPINVTLCSDDTSEPEHSHEEECVSCQIVESCPISNPMQKLNNLFCDFLSQITLQSLIENESAAHLPPPGVSV